VQHGPGPVVFVAADWFAGDPVDPGQPVELAAEQDSVYRRGRYAEPAADLDRAESLFEA
jgi:hypothetical protein